MKIPLKIAIDLVKRVEDLHFYEFVVSVPGGKASETIAFVEINEEGDVDISELKQIGFESLSDESIENLLVRVFKLAHNKMIEEEGCGIEWWISDLSKFLQRQFTATEAAAYSFALGNFVTDIQVQDMVVVRID